MEPVVFQDESQTQQPRMRQPRGLYKLAVDLKWARDEEGAKQLFIILIVVALVVAVVYPFLVL
ncbi:MAG TPA: hypothetical protein VEB18_00270 [Candidatus Paceibacterota bacterium]|nr:hypothetical protein [Candidatus Paceibacterota bacterium]